MAKKQTTEKVEKITRPSAVNRVIGELDGKSTLGELAAMADALVVAGGGDSNLRASIHYTKRALETAASLGSVKLTKPTDTLVEKLK